MASSTGVSPEALPLPKGGGAARGLGDGFTPDLNRGTGSYSIEIEVPKGRRQTAPSLSLAYNSAGGDGPFGFGWQMALPRLQADTSFGTLTGEPPELLFAGETLLDLGNGLFRPRVENAFHRIRRAGEGWEVTDKGGSVTLYGPTAASRIAGSVGGVPVVAAWLPARTVDTSGNEITFSYREDGGNLYLETVSWAVFQVRLTYEERPDPTVNRRTGFPVALRLRCTGIAVLRPGAPTPLIRRYLLTYGDDPTAPSLLASVQMEGTKRQPDGAVETALGPKLELAYTRFRPEERRFRLLGAHDPDFPGPLGRDGRELVDLSGDGLPDVVQLGNGRPRVWKNLGGGDFAPPRTLADFPDAHRLSQVGTALFDADGDGTADLVVLGAAGAHYYSNQADGTFGRPRYLGGRRPLDLDLADPDTRFANVFGGGTVDLVQTTARGLVMWRNRGGAEGFDPPVVRSRGSDRDAAPDVRLSDPDVFFADMTGDGLPDIVHVASGLVEYWPSLGGGRLDRRVVMESPPVLPRHHDHRRLFLADVDGSGTSDVVYVGEDRVLIWRNLGGRRFAPPIEVAGVPLSSADTIRLADLEGLGTTGILWSGTETAHRPGYRYLTLSEVKPYLLTRIDNGLGLETRIEYGASTAHAARDARAGRPWATRLPMPVQVIDRLVQHDRVTGAEAVTEISYHEGSWDPAVRRFRGFGRVTARRTGGPGSPDAVEEHSYLVGAPGEPPLDLADPEDITAASRGQSWRAVYFQGEPGSPPLRIEETHWTVAVLGVSLEGQRVLSPRVRSTEVRNLEGGDHPRLMVAEYDYDPFGNVTRERRTGSAPAGDDDGLPVPPLAAETRMEYAHHEERHIHDRMARTVRLDGDGNLLAEVRHYYDGPELVGLPLGQVDRGLLTRQEQIVLPRAEADAIYGAGAVDWSALGYHAAVRADGVPCWAVDETRVAYDGQGLPVRKLDALGAVTHLRYDADGLLVVEVENALGHRRQAAWDPSWQLIESRTDADSGITAYRYDPLGRLRSVVRPGDTAALPTVEYERRDDELPVRVHTRRRRTAGAAEVYEKVVFHDGFGREVQERARVDGETVRVTGTVSFTPKGEAASKGLPLLRQGLAFEPPGELPDTPRFQYVYDATGRLTAATNLEGRQVRVLYTPWSAAHHDVIDTDPAHPHHDTPRIEHFDAFGRLVGVTLRSTPGAGPRVTYNYDLLGRLLSTTDLEGRPALVSAVYDSRGARLRFAHAGCGSRTALYDATGRVVRLRDDRGRVVERTFDVLGRLATVAADGAVEERYHWDEAPAGPGRLHRVEDLAGAVTFGYDVRGQVARKVREIGGQTYTLEYGFDGAGLQIRQVYPDGTAVDIGRWEDGRVRSLGGFVDQVDWDFQGRLAGLRHANGVTETLTYDGSGYLAEMRADRVGETLRHALLTHDGAGHLKRHEEVAGLHPGVEIYEHNPLGRLVGFRTERDSGIEDRVYAYDADGNLLRADEMGADLYEYDFAAPGFLRRRTLTSGAVEDFAFDEAGHLASMPGLELTFDAHGRLIRVDKKDGTRIDMLYDYRGARVSKKVTGSPEGDYEVRYIDDLYEERQGLGTSWVYLKGRLVGQRRGGGTRHLHTDHRGSVVLATRPNGSADLRAWFGPFGLGDTLPAGEVSRQMTSAVLDAETGFYYFNHRYYSPSLGRFLSPDPRFLGRPERELDLPQAHNLYAYAANDPVDYIDPVGLGFWSDFGKVVAGIVVVIAVVAAIVVAAVVLAAALASGGWAIVLGATVLGAIIGGIQDGWEGALLGAMIGFTAGVNFSIAGPLGIITFLGVFKGIRQEGWYKSLAGWTSWFMPASWPGHTLGLGVFLANGIAHLFGSDKQIQSIRFDWKHGQILTAGGEYGGAPFAFAMEDAEAHNLGGFTFVANAEWTEGGGTWEGVQDRVDHETGHMLSNAIFGIWQGIVQGIEHVATGEHDDQLFEKIAESNVENDALKRDFGRELPFWG